MPMTASYKFNFNLYFSIVLVVLVAHFLLNFFASPYVLFSYILLSGIVFFGVTFYDLNKSLFLILIYFLIEGQGRVVTGYNPFARVAFDLVMLLVILSHVVRTRRLVPLSNLPHPISLLIICHLLIFTLSLFNPSGVGAWLSLPMAKVYVFPLLVFLMFLDSSIDFDSLEFKRAVYGLLLCIILIGIISLQQFQQGMPMMNKISEYYSSVGHLERFKLYSFRPFGTSHAAGGPSAYLYLTLGMLFLVPLPRWLLAMAIGLSIVVLILCQVRSSMILYGVMCISFLAINFLSSSSKVRDFLRGLFLMSLFGTLIFITFSLISTNKDQKHMDLIVNRSLSIFEKKTFKESRQGFDVIFREATKILQNHPFGFGPGRTYPVTTSMAEEIEKDPVYDSNYTWNYDNLWYTLIIEFGYGAIFYCLLILAMPLYLISMAVSVFRVKKINSEFKILFISGLTVSLITLANWGGIGIPYNPVSFMFWFWSAAGFRTFWKFKKSFSPRTMP
jgi:hypothetical protein